MTAFLVAICCAGGIYALGVSHGRQRERERIDAETRAVWANHATRRLLLDRGNAIDRQMRNEALRRIDQEAE